MSIAPIANTNWCSLLAFLALFLIPTARALAFTTPTRNRAAVQPSIRRTTATVMSSTSVDGADLPPDETLDLLLEVAVHASKLAGDIILGNAGGAEVTKVKASSRDLLTLIDPLCEKVRPTINATSFPK